jgi:acyl carrier protein
MDRNEIEQKVIDAVVFALCVVDKSTVQMGTKLADDLGGDSLDGVEVLMEVEDKFGIELNDPEAESWRTVEDICNSVEKALAGRVSL